MQIKLHSGFLVEAFIQIFSNLCTSFLVRTAASWISCLMASFVFCSSSVFCFSLNRAWRVNEKTQVHISVGKVLKCSRDEKTCQGIVKLKRLRRRLWKEWDKRQRQSNCSHLVFLQCSFLSHLNTFSDFGQGLILLLFKGGASCLEFPHLSLPHSLLSADCLCVLRCRF